MSIWRDEHPVNVDNAVTCQIKQLRKKLGNNPKGTPYIRRQFGVWDINSIRECNGESGTGNWAVPLLSLKNKDCDKLVIEGISDYNVTKKNDR